MNRRRFLQASLLAVPELFAKELSCDVAVIGGGVGGFAAALGALRNGMRVILTEETAWLGGQLTSQGVPPDEHQWIEKFGCTGTYRMYRNSVREYYRKNSRLTEAAKAREDLNPGNGSVSRLTHEFLVSVAVLDGILAPWVNSGHLVLLTEHVPQSAAVVMDRIRSVTLRDLRGGATRTIAAKYFIDATELGDLLALSGTESVTGAESRAETGELHAVDQAQPANSQSFTQCFAMDYLKGEDHTIDKPGEYGQWRDYVPQLTPSWPGKLLSWTYCDPRTLAPKKAYLDPNPAREREGMNLWTYRRIIDRTNFVPGTYASDITLVNWPQNDFWQGDLVTAIPEGRKELLKSAKQLSLSLLYWMQTEAGWKGLRLRRDIMGTEDGFARAPYIRESRRIRAEFTVTEQHVGREMRKKLPAETFADTVGIGAYRIDLHPSSGGTNYIDIDSLPFQIPMGALIPKRMENLLAGGKNIGVTHITNGCFRLHPVEWNIGEAAGCLAAAAIKRKQPPRAIRSNQKLLEDFQHLLGGQGFELEWPAAIRQ
jgi:hypothetical protein